MKCNAKTVAFLTNLISTYLLKRKHVYINCLPLETEKTFISHKELKTIIPTKRAIKSTKPQRRHIYLRAGTN